MLSKLDKKILRLRLGESLWLKYPTEKVTRGEGGYWHIIYTKTNNLYRNIHQSPISTFVQIKE